MKYTIKSLECGGSDTIEATSMKEALKKGAKWMLDGDWGSPYDNTYRQNLELHFRVEGETYYSILDLSTDALSIFKVAQDDPEFPIHDLDLQRINEDQLKTLAEYFRPKDSELEELSVSHLKKELETIENGNHIKYCDATEHTHLLISILLETLDIHKEEEDGVAYYSDEIPKCTSSCDTTGDDEGGHDWRTPKCIVGEFSSRFVSGTAMTHHSVCALCGATSVSYTTGSQKNPGDCDTVTITPLADIDDADDIRAWMIRRHAENEFIPQWLVNDLDLDSASTRYTREEAEEYVRNTNDDDVDLDELEHVYAALFGGRADAEEYNDMWSHCCSKVTTT